MESESFLFAIYTYLIFSKSKLFQKLRKFWLTNQKNLYFFQDGDHYTQLLDDNTNDLNALCKQYECYVTEGSDSLIDNEEGIEQKICKHYLFILTKSTIIKTHLVLFKALGQAQTTIGKAQLLVNQKMKQFRDLCAKNLVITHLIGFTSILRLFHKN